MKTWIPELSHVKFPFEALTQHRSLEDLKGPDPRRPDMPLDSAWVMGSYTAMHIK